MKNTIQDAVATAFREGYDQVVYTDSNGEYSFRRDYPCIHIPQEKVIGHVKTGWKNDIFYAEFCEKTI